MLCVPFYKKENACTKESVCDISRLKYTASTMETKYSSLFLISPILFVCCHLILLHRYLVATYCTVNNIQDYHRQIRSIMGVFKALGSLCDTIIFHSVKPTAPFSLTLDKQYYQTIPKSVSTLLPYIKSAHHRFPLTWQIHSPH